MATTIIIPSNLKIRKFANRIKRTLFPFVDGKTKKQEQKNGYFDWQYSGEPEWGDKEIEFEFYFDSIPNKYMAYVYSFMTQHKKYNPVMRGGKHDNSDKSFQIVIVLTVPITEI